VEVVDLEKPLIGVVSSIEFNQSDDIMPNLERIYVNDDYVQAVEKAGGNPIILPVVSDIDNIESQVQMCDGLVFTGGCDINPRFFNGKSNAKSGFSYLRVDEFQIKVIKKALELNKPSLCVCRGHQLLNVVCGGTIYQDISEIANNPLKHDQESPRYEATHKIRTADNTVVREIFGEEIWVNSFHHQCINKLGKNLKIAAVATDGIIESLQHEGKSFFISTQWHPEMMISFDNFMLPLFERLVYESKL
jgi:putative glutamine amidotransferase